MWMMVFCREFHLVLELQVIIDILHYLKKDQSSIIRWPYLFVGSFLYQNYLFFFVFTKTNYFSPVKRIFPSRSTKKSVFFPSASRTAVNASRLVNPNIHSLSSSNFEKKTSIRKSPSVYIKRIFLFLVVFSLFCRIGSSVFLQRKKKFFINLWIG